MNTTQKEIMLIAQEECAEVIQAISKVFRFGSDEEYNGQTNKMRLEEEVGDMLCMIEMMYRTKIIDDIAVEQARIQKKTKLAKWSQIDTAKDSVQ